MSDTKSHDFAISAVSSRETESEWLRLALAAVQMGTWEWNLLTDEIQWSDNLEEIHGMTPGSFDGTCESYLKVIHPDDCDLFRQAIQEALGNQTDFSVEFRIHWPDRSIHWIASKGRAFYTETGRPARMVGSCMDITDRILAARELREASYQNTAILESITDGFCALDSEWHITSINPLGAQFLRHTPLQLLGRNLWQMFPEAVDTIFYRNFHRAVAEHISIHFEEFYPPLNSWLDVRVFPIAEGGLTVLFQNISERKQTEAALLESGRLAALGAEVGNALIEENTLRAILGRCADAMVRHLNGAFARIWILNEAEQVLELQASAGMYTHLDGPHSRVPVGSFKIGLIALERQPHLTNAVLGDSRVGDQEWARREGMVAFAGYPLVVDDRLVGVMAMFARHALTASTLYAMESVANQIALGIERKRAEEAWREQAAKVVDLNAQLQRAITESHHRIKNNLQVLSVLVEMRILNSTGTVPVEELTRLGQHIRTLASLHDLLTSKAKGGPDSLDTISLKALLERLVPMLQTASGGRPIILDTEGAEAARISLREGSSFSLLVNELVSNAIKHGAGTVELTLRLLEGWQSEQEGQQVRRVRLEVCDDGPGFPEGFDPQAAANTGLELIESMGRWDLKGEIVYENRKQGGGRVSFIFPLPADQHSPL